MAGFITTFLQTAANPSFHQNLLHNLLYRKYVLHEEVPEAPTPPPPYFSQELFDTIREAKEASALNILKMTEKDWTMLLTENNVTMTSTDTETGEKVFTPCRAERVSPATDWEVSWLTCRQPGIPPDLASFLWCMLPDLLLTQSRLHHLGSVNSPICRTQGCNEEGSLLHELVQCEGNNRVGTKLVSVLKLHIPDLTDAALLRLDFGDLDQEMSLPVTLLTGIILNHLWRERQTGASIRGYKVRAELEQYITLLRTTRLHSTSSILDMTRSIFN